MRSFYAASQVARELEASGQAVRDWIEAGHLLAIQSTPGGRYKVPAQALLVFKQNTGLLPKGELSFPRGEELREFGSSEEIYAELIAPRLKAAGVSSL